MGVLCAVRALTAEGGSGRLRGMFFNGRLRVLGQLAAAVALFFIAGGHWGALQTVAWAGMLWTYTQEDGSLLSGVKKTFDGEHPCTMCDSIKEAKNQERSVPAAVAAVKKLEVFPAPLRAALPPRDCREFVFAPWAGLKGPRRADAPPVPVPIVGLV
jgi:hypothetical protein